MKLGPPHGSMDLLIVGAVLHFDAALVCMLRKLGVDVAHVKEIEEFLDRMDLWDRWQELYLNAGEEKALTFYKTNHAEMDHGAIVNWPEVEPLYALMVERA